MTMLMITIIGLLFMASIQSKSTGPALAYSTGTYDRAAHPHQERSGKMIFFKDSGQDEKNPFGWFKPMVSKIAHIDMKMTCHAKDAKGLLRRAGEYRKSHRYYDIAV